MVRRADAVRRTGWAATRQGLGVRAGLVGVAFTALFASLAYVAVAASLCSWGLSGLAWYCSWACDGSRGWCLQKAGCFFMALVLCFAFWDWGLVVSAVLGLDVPWLAQSELCFAGMCFERHREQCAHLEFVLSNCANMEFKVVKTNKLTKLVDAKGVGIQYAAARPQFAASDSLLEIEENKVKVYPPLGLALWSSAAPRCALETQYLELVQKALAPGLARRDKQLAMRVDALCFY